VDDLLAVEPFTPTILNGNYLYVTNTSGTNHSVTAFSYELMSGQSTPLWSNTFSGDLNNLGQPMYCNLSSTDGMIILSYSTTGPSYLVALDPLTGDLLWSYPFIEPIMGYACIPGEDRIIFVSSVRYLSAFHITSRNTIEQLWNVTSSPGPISSPTVDMNGNVYVCNLGRVIGYDLLGQMVSYVQHNPSLDNRCDQPIIFQSSILVRTNIQLSNQGILLVDLVSLMPPNPQPSNQPIAHNPANETGMIVGISVGVLFFLLGVLVLIFQYKRRRRLGYQYEVLY
jgi:hypothetical protein